MIPKLALALNWFGYADAAISRCCHLLMAAINKVPITPRSGIVYSSFYRQRPTRLSLLARVSSSRSASVSNCPHSHSKKVRAERHTDSGPPSTTFSPHSSQRRTTRLEESTTRLPPSRSLLRRGRHALTPARWAQDEPASTTRNLCFTHRYLNPRLRFRLARWDQRFRAKSPEPCSGQGSGRSGRTRRDRRAPRIGLQLAGRRGTRVGVVL